MILRVQSRVGLAKTSLQTFPLVVKTFLLHLFKKVVNMILTGVRTGRNGCLWEAPPVEKLGSSVALDVLCK